MIVTGTVLDNVVGGVGSKIIRDVTSRYAVARCGLWRLIGGPDD